MKNRRDQTSRLPDLAQVAAALEPLRRLRPAVPLVYVEFAEPVIPLPGARKRREAEHKRAIAAALRASLGSVLRREDLAAAGPRAKWFVALLVAKARKAKTQIADADLGVAAERLRRAVQDALARSQARPKSTAVRCGWTVLELDGALPRVALRQAVRSAAVAARIEERRATALAAITHELRTPLTAIVGFAERLRDAGPRDPGRIRAAEIISDEAQRLARLTQGLIDIGAWTAGHFQLRLEPCEVAVLAKNAAASVGDAARKKRVRIEVAGKARIQADRDRCRQVLLNLLDNAVRHSPESGRVDVRIRTNASACTVAVADSGPGFPSAVRRSLGRPFARGADGGSGLGLAISKLLVEAHGGRIAAGRGPRGLVTVTLPRKGPKREEALSVGAAKNPAGPNTRL